MRSTTLTHALLAPMLLLAGAPAAAQDPHVGIAFSPLNIEFMSEPMAFDSEPVAGAPYSAEAVTVVVQTLADGNRITRESKAQISRDAKGRSRREQSLAMFGPLVGGPVGGNDTRHVQISDPVARTTTMLDLRSRTAHRMPAPRIKLMTKGDAKGVEVHTNTFQMALPAPPPGTPQAGVRIYSGRTMMAGGQENPVVENLGTQSMEGVTVEGTKITTTIPAGQIGNELPINVVSERWFSPELKVMVMSRQSDPRFGETTYRLTNITLGEPAADLFEIPADFKVIDPGGSHDVVIQRKVTTK
jgi:hypothetical protein